jgi:hypothetical protein
MIVIFVHHRLSKLSTFMEKLLRPSAPCSCLDIILDGTSSSTRPRLGESAADRYWSMCPWAWARQRQPAQSAQRLLIGKMRGPHLTHAAAHKWATKNRYSSICAPLSLPPMPNYWLKSWLYVVQWCTEWLYVLESLTLSKLFNSLGEGILKQVLLKQRTDN